MSSLWEPENRLETTRSRPDTQIIHLGRTWRNTGEAIGSVLTSDGVFVRQQVLVLGANAGTSRNSEPVMVPGLFLSS